MTKYPSDEEIKKIVTKRKQLAQELIGYLMLTGERERNERFKRLVSRYGQADVDRELVSYRERANMLSNPDNENIVFYSEYVNHYRRFGGDRPFLTLEEYVEANDEAAPLIIRNEVGQTLTETEQERLVYLSDLLLKEAVFWDDIMPENPPPTLPDVKLPPIKISVPRPAAGHLLSSYPLCPDDGFPLLIIDDELVCCFEALDHCLRQRMVVDVVQRGKITYYVFDDGHELPLLCGCCGQGLRVDDLAKEHEEICGRRFTGMSIKTKALEKEDREYDQLVLEFSKSGLFLQPMQVPVAFEVAAGLRHPSPGPNRRRASASKNSTSKKKASSRKKRRSGKKRGRKKNR